MTCETSLELAKPVQNMLIQFKVCMLTLFHIPYVDIFDNFDRVLNSNSSTSVAQCMLAKGHFFLKFLEFFDMRSLLWWNFEPPRHVKVKPRLTHLILSAFIHN